MSENQVQNTFNLLGQALPSRTPIHLSGDQEPRLEIAWGSFRQGLASYLPVLFGPGVPKRFLNAGYFHDVWIEGRIPRRAVLAALLWHVVFLVMPSPRLPVPPRNPAFENVELTWSGPIHDLPLLDMPRQNSQPKAPEKSDVPIPKRGADAYHPRQRIFTDPAHPTHPRQTLINPKAPMEAPKILPNLPNIVQFAASAAPARPRVQISREALERLHPRNMQSATAAPVQAPDMPELTPQAAQLTLPQTQAVPARPKAQLDASAAPHVIQPAQTAEEQPAPQLEQRPSGAANGSDTTLIALSATPAPPAPVVNVPQGNLAARINIGPDAAQPGAPNGSPKGGAGASGNSGAGKGESSGNNPIGISISGGSPSSTTSGLGGSGGAGKFTTPSAHALLTHPERMPKDRDEEIPVRTGPPDFASLPAGAKPEQIFIAKHVYQLKVDMPNLTSSTGSWILNFSELRSDPYAPHVTSTSLSGPVLIKKVDPKYPPALIADRVAGEVILYAVIRRDGTVDSIQLVRGIDEHLDENAMSALGQWKFRPATKEGVPIELEAIVHIPFHLPELEP